MSRIGFDNVQVGSAQVWGNVRLVPLLRETPVLDLRLGVREYDSSSAVVRLNEKLVYTSYVPHGLVLRWSADGEAEVPVDTMLGSKDRQRAGHFHTSLRRMARREGSRGLRLLPMHLAMEGFLSLQFGGPQIARRFWSRKVLQDGLSPRSESSVAGTGISGLSEALALFERHADQCGVAVFIGDHLASLTLVGHPHDYARLHHTLVRDLYGMLFAQSGWAFRDVSPFEVTLSGTSLQAIRRSLHAARADAARFSREMADGVFNRELELEVVRKVGRWKLVRFHTGFLSARTPVVGGEHIGEALLDADQQVVYVKTYRLDRGQMRRGYLLSELARVEWDVERLAKEQGHGDARRVAGDLDQAGLGWVVR